MALLPHIIQQQVLDVRTLSPGCNYIDYPKLLREAQPGLRAKCECIFMMFPLLCFFFVFYMFNSYSCWFAREARKFSFYHLYAFACIVCLCLYLCIYIYIYIYLLFIYFMVCLFVCICCLFSCAKHASARVYADTLVCKPLLRPL